MSTLGSTGDGLSAGRRPPVLVTVNGYEYRTTVGVMNGRAMISEVTVPPDFADALAADQPAGAFFGGLSNSVQRHHIDTA